MAKKVSVSGDDSQAGIPVPPDQPQTGSAVPPDDEFEMETLHELDVDWDGEGPDPGKTYPKGTVLKFPNPLAAQIYLSDGIMRPVNEKAKQLMNTLGIAEKDLAKRSREYAVKDRGGLVSRE